MNKCCKNKNNCFNMKKVIIISIVLISILLVGCIGSNSIVGKWKCDDNRHKYEFTNDGVWIVNGQERGTYTFDSNNIFIYDGQYDYNFHWGYTMVDSDTMYIQTSAAGRWIFERI